MAGKKPPGSRVRGATQIRQRSDWKYRIGHLDWIERLNFVRSKLGDEKTAELLGYSTTDKSFKSVRRLTSGERLPDRERYEIINRAYTKFQRVRKLIPLAEEMRSLMVGFVEPKFITKINSFLVRMGSFRYRDVMSNGWLPPGTDEAADRMIGAAGGGQYIRCCDASGYYLASGRQSIAIVMVAIYDSRDVENTIRTEAWLIRRISSPSVELMQNAIDTYIEVFKAMSYITFQILGVWWSYVASEQ